MAHEKKLILTFGTGKFDYFKIISSRKCACCPYRGFDAHPVMKPVRIFFTRCFYKYSGFIVRDNDEKEVFLPTKWFKVETEEN